MWFNRLCLHPSAKHVILRIIMRNSGHAELVKTIERGGTVASYANSCSFYLLGMVFVND